MKSCRLKKLGISFFVVLSLFVSSAAACACSHHQAKPKMSAPACHQASHEAEEIQISESDEAKSSANVDEACNCFVKNASPFVLNKSENIKTQKNPAALPLLPNGEISVEISAITSVKFDYFYHFYNSNYLKKLTPSRAPPIS